MPIGEQIIKIFKNLPYEEWANKFIGVYVEGQPGPDYARFGRSVYRLCRAKAAATQLDCYAFWFGETIRVQPSGSFGSAGSPMSISIFWQYIDQLKNTGASFYVIQCGVNVDWEKHETIKQGCHFTPFGPKTSIKPGLIPPGQQLSAGLVGWAALAGIALIYFWRKK